MTTHAAVKYFVSVTRNCLRNLSSRKRLLFVVVSLIALLHVFHDVIAKVETLNSVTSRNRSSSLQRRASDNDEAIITSKTVTIDDVTDSTCRPLSATARASSSACPLVRRPLVNVSGVNGGEDGGRWQTHETKSDRIAVYSAFYDDRIPNQATIRILGVARRLRSVPFCYVWYPECTAPYVTRAVVDVTGRSHGHVIDGVIYVQYLFSCHLPPLPSTGKRKERPISLPFPLPSQVSIVPDCCTTAQILLPIEQPLHSSSFSFPSNYSSSALPSEDKSATEPEVEFGACVAIAFGSLPVPVFVEWMEFHWLLGVREFNVYDAGMRNMAEVFDVYRKRGWLRVHRMPPPVDAAAGHQADNTSSGRVKFSLDAVKLASPASLNDCMMRNVHRYRLVVVVDFDEFVVPRQHDNYTQLIDHLDRQHSGGERRSARPRYSTYMFRNSYFFLDLRPDESQPTYVRTLRYRQRAPVSPFKFVPKSFIDPRACLSVFNHYCFLPLHPHQSLQQQQPHSQVQTGVLDVSAQLATSHHYRHCNLSARRCKSYLHRQHTADDSVLRFAHRLRPAVDATLAQLAAGG